jgi:hypothetical protein
MWGQRGSWASPISSLLVDTDGGPKWMHLRSLEALRLDARGRISCYEGTAVARTATQETGELAVRPPEVVRDAPQSGSE